MAYDCVRVSLSTTSIYFAPFAKNSSMRHEAFGVMIAQGLREAAAKEVQKKK